MAELATAFSLGLLATVSPCFLPLYPGFLAYLSAQAAAGGVHSRRVQSWLGLLVMGGAMSSMLVIGGAISLLGLAIGQVLVIVTPTADLIVIGLGTLLLGGVDVFGRLPPLALPGGMSPAGQAYWYGVLYGPMLMPCTAPLLISVFTLSLVSISIPARLLFIAFFGLGLGTPLLALSLLSQVRQQQFMSWIRRFFSLARRAAGVALIAVGAADLAQQWPHLQLYLGL